MRKTIGKLGRVSTQSVFKGTGKSWDTWVNIFTKTRAQDWSHKDLVAFLQNKYNLGPWWEQGVALGYELYLGRREENRNARGEYSLTATKSLHIDQKRLWKFIFSKSGQALWLPSMYPIAPKEKKPFELEDGTFGEVRSLEAPNRIRLSWRREEWEKPTYLDISLVARPNSKSILVFQHSKIANEFLYVSFREHWKKVLGDIRERISAHPLK